MSPPRILQGTDGIRGRISQDRPAACGRNALQYYLERGFLTPAFFEHYTYAYASLLLATGNAVRNDAVVIGWDPRDDSGTFNRAAISGLRKAGLKVVVAGTLPTPAIPLYMLKIEASGGVVLTASHNPADQNGIKLFHGWTALKFLPADDLQLSDLIFRQQALDLDALPESGPLVDHTAAAKSFFINYLTDSRNSWIDRQTFEDQLLVIDASNGAVASVVREVLAHYRFDEVIYTNLAGAINRSCGVADLEGLEVIAADEIIPENSRFFSYPALQAMMITAARRREVRTGAKRLSGLVFDGDGDRCFMLDYDPDADAIVISSGDQIGIQLLRYLKHRQGGSAEGGWFVNTVESDLKTAITAEAEGFATVLTGVGDKWILKHAVLDHIRRGLESGRPGGDAVRRHLELASAGGELSGSGLSRDWKNYCRTLTSPLPEEGCRFRVGIEESGHSITPGFIDVQGQSRRCFAGNGIKSGLNALAAVQQLCREKTGAERIAWIRQPFQPGLKKTCYVYYVNKEQLLPGSLFRLELEGEMAAAFAAVFPADYRAEPQRFSEEEGLVFLRVSRDGKTAGAVFLRHSGTEDKSALYLRGSADIAPWLEQVGFRLHLFLLRGMKNGASEFVALEKALLKTIRRGDPIEPLRDSFAALPFDRVLKEVQFKEGLILTDGGVSKLTEKGKFLNDVWEAKEKSASEEKR